MKLKKLIIFILVSAMVFSVAGCSEKTAKSTDDVPVITWYVPGEPSSETDLVMEEINKLIEPKIGARLELVIIDDGAYEQRMNMMMTADQDYDICFTSNWSNKFLPNVEKDAYMPLSQLMEEYAPSLSEIIPEVAWTGSTVNGEIYAVPNMQVLFHRFAINMIKDLTDKYNLDVDKVKKVEDIEPLLAKVKENEPDIIPFNPNIEIWMGLDYEEIKTAKCFIKKDGSDFTVLQRERMPEYIQGIKTLRDWFQKGYIRQDIASNPGQPSSLLKIAASISTWVPGVEEEFAPLYGYEPVFAKLEDIYLDANAGSDTMTAINKKSKHPEKAMQLIELINTDKEIFNMLVFGIEGKHYTKIGENRIEINNDAPKYLGANYAWRFGNSFNAYLLPGVAEDKAEITQKLNETATVSPISGFVFNAEPVKAAITQVNAVRGEYKALELGAVDTGVYEEYLAKLDSAGMQEIIAECQRQLDEFLKNK